MEKSLNDHILKNVEEPPELPTDTKLTSDSESSDDDDGYRRFMGMEKKKDSVCSETDEWSGEDGGLSKRKRKRRARRVVIDEAGKNKDGAGALVGADEIGID
jgi:hypothetical protein